MGDFCQNRQTDYCNTRESLEIDTITCMDLKSAKSRISKLMEWGVHFSKWYHITKGFPGGSDGKEFASNLGDLGLIPESGRSAGGGHGNPLQYSCLENPHGQRSLVCYNPWGHKESDTTELLSTAQHII